MDSEDVYREKYLKYKKKYNELKNLDQEGGLFNFGAKLGFGGPVAKANSNFHTQVEALLNTFTKAFMTTEYKDLIKGMPKDVVGGYQDRSTVTKTLNSLTGYKYTVSTGKILSRIREAEMYKIKDTDGKKEAIPSKAGVNSYGEKDYKDELLDAINDVVRGVNAKDKKVGKEIFPGKIIKVEADVIDQKSFNTWATKIIEHEQDQIIEKLEKEEGYEDAKKNGTGGDLSIYSEKPRGEKISLLRNKQTAMKKCHSEGLPKTWLACTEPKLNAYVYVKKNVPEILKEKENFEEFIKKLPKEFKSEIDALNEKFEEFFKSRVEGVNKELGEIEVTEKNFKVSELKQAIISAGLDYNPKKDLKPESDEEDSGSDTDKEEEEQEGGFLPEFLTETPRFN